jgi:hypothetical protein
MNTEPLTKEEIVARLRAAAKANPRPRPRPPAQPPTKAQRAEERFAASNQPDEAVFDAAARGNDAAIERLETMEERRQKQIAKELAEHNAEGEAWHNMVRWQQTMERAQERLRALDGEIPERGVYDPIRRFEREQRGR